MLIILVAVLSKRVSDKRALRSDNQWKTHAFFGIVKQRVEAITTLAFTF